MSFFDPITFTLSMMSILGAILVGLKRIEGFYLWIVANIGWIVVNISTNMLADQVFMWSTFTAISIFSIYYWRRDDKRRRDQPDEQEED